eukprot:TRINITY_DN25427_c0_g1_i1.p1 TRINITY_DN25427_c0_g1~~TRINITY_DN25427_c0_g1_i1.p1  ORF type:complete len:294 (+),score=49.51 TRINITY_DN25427_c0_g1_i1:74-883(+)
MGDPKVDQFFREQMKDPANRTCCDSGLSDPQWASISHGIYISIGACGVHRSLGVKTSFVQSIYMDAWKPLHLRMMELGGNSRFNSFMLEHGIPDEMPIREKYSTRAARWYREALKAEAEGLRPPEPLEIGTGHLPVDEDQSEERKLLDQVFAQVPGQGALSVSSTYGGRQGDQSPGCPDLETNLSGAYSRACWAASAGFLLLLAGSAVTAGGCCRRRQVAEDGSPSCDEFSEEKPLCNNFESEDAQEAAVKGHKAGHIGAGLSAIAAMI